MEPLYIIVPVFNGERYIDDFIRQFPIDYRSHVIFVNDGSNDDSRSLLDKHNMKVVNHETNKGKGAAIRSALDMIKKEGGGTTVILDIDLQHPPQLLYMFSNCNESSVKLGYRFSRRNMPLLRQLSNFLTSVLITVRSGKVIKDSQCGYRSFHTSLFDKIHCKENGFQFDSEMLIKAAIIDSKVEHIRVPTIYDDQGSAMNNFTDTIKFIRMWIMSYFWT